MLRITHLVPQCFPHLRLEAPLRQPSVHFTNIFTSSFCARRFQKHKKTDDLTVFFTLLGSARVNDLRKTLMKLSPSVHPYPYNQFEFRATWLCRILSFFQIRIHEIKNQPFCGQVKFLKNVGLTIYKFYMHFPYIIYNRGGQTFC